MWLICIYLLLSTRWNETRSRQDSQGQQRYQGISATNRREWYGDRSTAYCAHHVPDELLSDSLQHVVGVRREKSICWNLKTTWFPRLIRVHMQDHLTVIGNMSGPVLGLREKVERGRGTRGPELTAGFLFQKLAFRRSHTVVAEISDRGPYAPERCISQREG